jgi:tetratricopeptide (TPR) repeat protein
VKWLMLLLLAGCATKTHPLEDQAHRQATQVREDRAMRAFVEGAEQLARGTPRSLARAREQLGEALELNPKLWEAHYDLGLTERRLGALDRARPSLETAHQLAPDAAEPLFALADVSLALGDRDAAARYLEQYLERQPAQVDAKLALAAVERERGKLERALALAREVLIKDPRAIEALLEVGRIYRARDEYEVAELVLEKARALVEGSGASAREQSTEGGALVFNELGLLALARGDTQLAFTHFGRAEQLDPHFLPAHVNQGSVLLRAGDYEAAERAYKAAVHEKEDPARASLREDALIGLGIAQRGQGKYREARATYEKVLDAHPSQLAALYDLAVLLADFMDQRKAALPLFERYLTTAPNSDSHRASAERYVQDIRMATGSTTP